MKNVYHMPGLLRVPLQGVFLLCMMLASKAGTAQSDKHTLNGKVFSAKDNTPLPGVNILVKSNRTGTVSGGNGAFVVQVNNNDTLEISLIGFVKQLVAVNGRSSISLQLKENSTGLDEVVVVGFGSEKKKLNTGAIGHVNGAALQETHTLRVDQALQGQTPGVQITTNSAQPGEAMKVRIRGTGTVGNADPLYIVDGVPTGDISYLNSSDVASMDVLKDAASAAIYGSRAANGVILITTKKGKKGDMTVAYDGFYGVQNPARKLPLLNAREFAIIMNEAAINSGRPPYFSLDQVNNYGKGTDWQQHIYNDNAPMQSHTLTISGGSEKSTYSTAVGYMKQAGVIGFKGQSEYERLNIRLSTEHKMYKDVLRFGQNFTYTMSNKKGVGVGNIYGNTLRPVINVSPLFPVYDSTGDFAKSGFNPDETNPVALMYYQYNNKTKSDRFLGNVYLELEPVKGLKLRSDFGMDANFVSGNAFFPEYNLSTNVVNNHSRAAQDMGRYATWNWDNTISYQRDFGKHNINVLAGMTSNEFNGFNMSGSKEDLLVLDFAHAIIDNGTNEETRKVWGSRSESALLSYFGRVGYNYAEKYMLTAIFRADGSTKFGANNRFGYFPSVSAGWVATNEKFFQSNWLTFLKLRAGWGQNGNQPTDDFLYLATITSTNKDYYFGEGDVKFVGSSPDRVANPDLKWETSEQTNIGLDAQFLGNFNLTFDWYRKTTKDWLIAPPVPALAGANPPMINGGSVKNEGVEISLGYQRTFGDVSVSVNPNVTFNKNTVIDIPNQEKIIQGEAGINFVGGDEFFRAQKGFPMGYFYGLQTAGIFQNTSEVNSYVDKGGKRIQPDALPGDVRFVDRNGDGLIDSRDKTMIGNPNPDVSYGLNLSVNYKGIDLSVYLYGVAGNQVYDGIRDFSRPQSNYTTEILGRWTGEGTSNRLPRMTLHDEKNLNYTRASDLFVHDANFLRFRSINLGYDLKQSLLRKVRLQQCRLYVSGLNLLTLTKYKGMDPEVGYAPTGWASGIDIGTYPQPKTLMVGLNVKL
jgi:TonB-dependent starch-binding outer membrane protein SusC